MNYQLIAVFTDTNLGFRGNTSAVICLEQPLSSSQMQNIAADFNQPATTFIWKANYKTHIRWFAPDSEISLCGHGSAAALAFNKGFNQCIFHYNGGQIKGKLITDEKFELVINSIASAQAEIPEVVVEGFNALPESYFVNNNKQIVLYKNESIIKAIKPDFNRLRESSTFGYILTAPGDNADFVSRTIVPHVQQLEDPATGSSHAALAPFWAERLQKSELTAMQLSKRGGKFSCALNDDHTISLKGNFYVFGEGKVDLSKY